MASKDSNKPESTFNESEDSLSPDRPLRLSVKGAVRETGNLPKFEVSFDPNSHTAQFEKDTILREQLESADFYIDQGFMEVAFTTLERLEMIFPNHPLISERLDRMANMELTGVVKVDEPAKPKPDVFAKSRFTTAPNPKADFPIEAPPFDEANKVTVKLPQLSDLIPSLPEFRVLNTGQLLEIKEASDEDDAANIPEITVEQMEPIIEETGLLPAIGAALFTESPILTPVNNKPSEFALNSTSNSKYSTAPLTSPAESEETVYEPAALNDSAVSEDVEIVLPTIEDAPTTGFADVQSGLQSLFEEFDNEVDEDIDSDFQSHFNMGLAYFEIELWDDAIEEFQAAYRAVSTGSPHSRTFNCCLMLGRCFHAKGMLRPALIWLRRAVDTPGHAETDYMEGRYEMALVHEKLGERKKARELFEQIANVDANYLDVQAKLEELKTKN